MSNSYKRTVAISSIVASDLNARRDYSDVAELAEAIRATGGQPVNPIIVRPMSDGTYRIIDGERRYRALCSIGAETTDVYVYPDTTDAAEALAILATDSKRRLSDSEVVRAYQQVLDLGVDDERVGLAVGLDADAVRRTRRVPRELITEQTSLDALIAAADDEFSEEERKSIIAEGGRTWGDPAAQADRIRKRHIKERAQEEAREALADEFGDCITFHDQPTSEWAAERDGQLYVGAVKDANGPARIAKKLAEGAALHAYPKATGIGFEVYRKKEDGELTEKEAEKAKMQKARDEHTEAYGKVYAEMCRFATEPWWSEDAPRVRSLASVPHIPANRRPNLCTEVTKDRFGDYGSYRAVFSKSGREVLRVAATVAEDEDPSLLEVCEWLVSKANMASGMMSYYNAEISPTGAARFRLVYDTLLLDGWKPSEEAQALRALCPDEEKETKDDNDDAE